MSTHKDQQYYDYMNWYYYTYGQYPTVTDSKGNAHQVTKVTPGSKYNLGLLGSVLIGLGVVVLLVALGIGVIVSSS